MIGNETDRDDSIQTMTIQDAKDIQSIIILIDRVVVAVVTAIVVVNHATTKKSTQIVVAAARHDTKTGVEIDIVTLRHPRRLLHLHQIIRLLLDVLRVNAKTLTEDHTLDLDLSRTHQKVNIFLQYFKFNTFKILNCYQIEQLKILRNNDVKISTKRVFVVKASYVHMITAAK